MSDRGDMGLDGLGQGALRMARSLFAPDAAPACPSAYDGLLTDPAAHLNALFAPFTPFLHGTAAPSPPPPESDVEPRRDTLPAGERTRQAASDAKTKEMPAVRGWADSWNKTPTDTRTALSPATAAPPVSVFAPSFPMRTSVPRQDAAAARESETRVLPNAPDALDGLRFLTTTARTSLLPSAIGNSHPRKPETRPANAPVASENPALRSPNAFPFLPARGGSEEGREPWRPFPATPSSGVGKPLPIRQEQTGQYETTRDGRQAAPSIPVGQSGEDDAPAPLRMMRGASPLAAMLQTHIRPLPLDTAPSPAPPGVPNWPAPQADTPPGPLRPAPFASRAATAAGVQESALPPHDAPTEAPPPAAAPPDADALIQALEAHLELEFLRTYGTSGR